MATTHILDNTSKKPAGLKLARRRWHVPLPSDHLLLWQYFMMLATPSKDKPIAVRAFMFPTFGI
jgi:hypothetical protein